MRPITAQSQPAAVVLRHQLQSSWWGMGRLIAIGTYATRDEAEIVEGLLASAGIVASVRADDAGGAYPFVLSGGAQVLVDETDAEEASQLLAEPADEA